MKDIPILFSTPMVLAILNNEKTNTRRVIKNQPSDEVGEFLRQLWPCKRKQYEYMGDPEQGHEVNTKPYAFPGDSFYVRESWNLFLNNEGPEGYTRLIQYSADGATIAVPEEHFQWFDEKEKNGYLKRPSIFMPKWASRIWLKVKNIRVEKLQDISEEDSLKEGIRSFTKDGVGFKYGLDGWHWSCQTGSPFMCNTAKIAFELLWDSINGKPRKNGVDISWGANPWTWGIEFQKKRKAQLTVKHGGKNDDKG